MPSRCECVSTHFTEPHTYVCDFQSKTSHVQPLSKAALLQSQTITLHEVGLLYAENLTSLFKRSIFFYKSKLSGAGQFPAPAMQPSALSCTDEVPQPTKQKNNLCLPRLGWDRRGRPGIKAGLHTAPGGLGLGHH